jgi:hypothetical protein
LNQRRCAVTHGAGKRFLLEISVKGLRRQRIGLPGGDMRPILPAIPQHFRVAAE